MAPTAPGMSHGRGRSLPRMSIRRRQGTLRLSSWIAGSHSSPESPSQLPGPSAYSRCSTTSRGRRSRRTRRRSSALGRRSGCASLSSSAGRSRCTEVSTGYQSNSCIGSVSTSALPFYLDFKLSLLNTEFCPLDGVTLFCHLLLKTLKVVFRPPELRLCVCLIAHSLWPLLCVAAAGVPQRRQNL